MKLVGKESAADKADASDVLSAMLGAKTKAAKAKVTLDAKNHPTVSSTDPVQGQFSALLNEVEKKLTVAADNPDDTERDADDGDSDVEDDGAVATDDTSVKSQNGTTSLFASAFMMRGWEPGLIAQADAARSEGGTDEKPAAANSNKADMIARLPDIKTEGKTSTKVDAAVSTPAQPEKAQPRLKLIEAQAQTDKVQAGSDAAVKSDVPQVQVSAQLKTDIQTASSRADRATPDSAVIAEAQAQGVVSSIHVSQARDAESGNGRGDERQKDDTHKDEAIAAKTETPAAVAVKAETVAATVVAAPAETASPISQVVERILQELPTQNLSASADQVAQASKVMTVRLHPEGLGNVLVKISNSGGNLKISLASEQKATSDQMESDSSQLLQALQQVLPSFSADNLSFSTQDQGSNDAQNNSGANQNATSGNSNSGQWNEGQSYAEQGGRQVPGSKSYGRTRDGSGDVQTVPDAGRGQRAGSIYL